MLPATTQVGLLGLLLDIAQGVPRIAVEDLARLDGDVGSCLHLGLRRTDKPGGNESEARETDNTSHS